MTRPCWSTAWLGLGSNLDDPAGQLRSALRALRAHLSIQVLAVSAFYRTIPVGGPAGQPMFCNAAVKLATCLSPPALLDVLQSIEQAHGRVRDVRWGPRTLDLDILAYADVKQQTETLTLPHPRAHERGFVLVPLADIAPDLYLGEHGAVKALLAEQNIDDIQRWSAEPVPE